MKRQSNAGREALLHNLEKHMVYVWWW